MNLCGSVCVDALAQISGVEEGGSGTWFCACTGQRMLLLVGAAVVNQALGSVIDRNR